MLKKANRLSKFNNLENLKSVSTPYFVLKYKREEEALARFGFVVSKKIDKRAVIRNKVKRKLQQAVRESLGNVLPYTFLIIAKRESIQEESKKISEALKEILIKENIIK